MVKNNTTKEACYEQVVENISRLIEGETVEVSVLANVSAALYEAFDSYFWVGFYLVRNDQLVLGPFQGPVACYRIKRGRGVCGTAWSEAKTLVVPDVEQFPGHIACSSLSRSEVVVPIFNGKHEVCAVLDIDSKELNAFDEVDARYLEQLVASISATLYNVDSVDFLG